MTYDYCIIGGGIVGLATGMALLERQPGASLVLLEKESALAQHQTGHNSGVIHAGIYYAPGSLKAELCRRGALATKAFCDQHSIPYEVCGKFVVATTALELERMNALFERAKTNKIDIDRLDGNELQTLEPNIVGLGALFVKTTGIVDYEVVAKTMGTVIHSKGGELVCSAEVTAIRESTDDVTVSTREHSWTARRLIVCGGLQSDRLARLAGLRLEHQIVPFRGEYFRLPATKNGIVRHLIYPVPDPDLPFLGIHLTRMIDGGVTVGPNAVLGFAREGYPKFSIHAADVAAYAGFGGFWKMIGNNWRSGLIEGRNSLWKRWYLRECRKYCPSLAIDDLLPEKAGIRAQAVARDGSLIHDFLFVHTDRMLHVCNAPSPAATSAIPIGEMIADECFGRGSQTPGRG